MSAKVGVYTLFVTTCCKVDGAARCHTVGVVEDEDVGREKAYNNSLKAFVDAQWLADFDTRLETYRTALSGAAPDPEAADG